jgi:hypothetical protein
VAVTEVLSSGVFDPERVITSREAQRALYLDFEGRTDEAPTVLGVLYNQSRSGTQVRWSMEQAVVEQQLAWLEDVATVSYFSRYRNDARSLTEVLQSYVRLAEKQDRLIVAWSRHDLEVVERTLANDDLVERFRARYRNARKTGTRWLTICRPDL